MMSLQSFARLCFALGTALQKEIIEMFSDILATFPGAPTLPLLKPDSILLESSLKPIGWTCD